MTQMMPNMWTMIFMMNMIMMNSLIKKNHFVKMKKINLKIHYKKNNW